MALRHLDFPSAQVGMYGTDKALLLDGVYVEAGGPLTQIEDDPDPNITGNVLRIAPTAVEDILRWVLPSLQTKVGLGRRVWMAGLNTNSGTGTVFAAFRDVGNNNLATVYSDSTGRIVITGGGGAAVSSSGPAIVANAWQHLEAAIDTVAGSLEVRVEGVVVASYTGRAFGASVAQVAISSASGFAFQWLKDLVIWDGTGAFNNTFMGSIQVRELIPDGDNLFNWTASSGTTGWNLIDEAPPNDDTDYIIAANPPPGVSRFDVTNLPVDVTSVRGIRAVVRSRKTDGGDGNLQVGLRHSGSTALGANRPITTSYTYWSDIFETDPSTGAAWTPAGVNAVHLQVNRTL